MSDHYTLESRRTYKPDPCPLCGSRNVHVNWVETTGQFELERQFIPGTSDCLDCKGRGPR